MDDAAFIVTIEHSANAAVLTEPAIEVAFPLSQSDHDFISAMKEMVLTLNGVGLAAPQVRVNKKIIVYSISDDAIALRKDANETVPITVLINPRYEPAKDAEIIYDWEACFSVANKTGKVPRYNKITYTARTPEGELINATATGFTARVLQHEIDHIQGILIIDRLTPDCVQGHPHDMMALRFKDLTSEQKHIAREIFLKRQQTVPAEDTSQHKMIADALEALNEKTD